MARHRVLAIFFALIASIKPTLLDPGNPVECKSWGRVLGNLSVGKRGDTKGQISQPVFEE